MVYDSYNQLFLLGWSNFQMSMTSMLVCVGVSMSFWLWAIIVPTAIGFAIFVLSLLLLVWFCAWACWVCFPFWRFLVLCCDCVQHNVLCNESEFSTVCVIQTVGSPVTRQGLNCFFCVSIPENNFLHFVFIQMPGYHVPCTNISLFSIFICQNFGTSHPGSNKNTFLGCSLMFIC